MPISERALKFLADNPDVPTPTKSGGLSSRALKFLADNPDTAPVKSERDEGIEAIKDFEEKGPSVSESLLSGVKEGISKANPLQGLNAARRSANILSASALAPVMRGLLKAGESSPINAPSLRKGAEHFKDILETAQQEPPTDYEKFLDVDLSKTRGINYKPEYLEKGMRAINIDPNHPVSKVARGIIDPIGETASSFSTPANLATLGLGAAKGAGTVFAPMMVEGAIDQAKELPGAIAEKDPYKIAKSLVGSTLSGSLAGLGLAHDFIPGKPVGKGVEYGKESAAENTVASKTVPETPQTLNIQLDALKARRVPAVLITEGEAVPSTPKGFRSTETPVGTFVHDPMKLSSQTIKEKVADGTHGEILGHVEPKSEKTTQTVAAITPKGVEAKTSIVSPDNVVPQAEILKQQFPDAEIKVGGEELAQKVIQGRQAENPASQKSPEINAIRIAKTEKTKSYADIKNKPSDELITVYRGIPKIKGAKIDAGDFVAVDREIAKSYASDLIRRGRANEVVILSKKVPASEIKLHPDHEAHGVENEFIYNPSKLEKVIEQRQPKEIAKPIQKKPHEMTEDEYVANYSKDRQLTPEEESLVRNNHKEMVDEQKPVKAIEPVTKPIKENSKITVDDSLSDFVRKSGGINDLLEPLKGEVRDSFSRKEAGGSLINRKNGKTLDHLREISNEAGYGPFETTRDFVDGLHKDHNARMTGGSERSYSIARDYDADLNRQFRDHIEKTSSPEEIAEAQKEWEKATNPEEKEAVLIKSRVYERMKEETPEALRDDPSYQKVILKEDANRAINLIKEDKNKALRIALGFEESKDVLSTSVNIAMAERALAEGNIELYNRLTTKRSLDQTRRGQEIVAEKGSVTDNSVARYVKDLIQIKMQNASKNFLSNLSDKLLKKEGSRSKVTEKIDKEVAKIEKKLSKRELDLKEAQSFLDSLKCK